MLYCFLAPGFEETEAIAPIDLLRRAKIDVLTVGVGAKQITGSHGIPFVCDLTDDAIVLDDTLSGVILPGGMPGTINLENSDSVQRALDYCFENGKLLCAICAAPSVLGHKGFLKGKTAIAFPGFEDDLKGAVLSQTPVAVDGNIITAKGAGVALDFGFAIVAALKDQQTADAIRQSIQCP